MNIQHKDASITPTGDDGAFPGTFEVVLSTGAKDRDGDTLAPDEWKQPLPDHITFDADHGMSVATTVGSGVPSLEDGKLIVRGTFSSLPRAQEVRTLVKEGHIRTTSVAFMTEKSTEKNARIARELLNGAFVAIPSNREALVTGAKSAGQAPEFKSIVGSLEAQQDRARDALEDAYGEYSTYLRGVLPDVLVFEVWSDCTPGLDSGTYTQPYTDDGAVVTLTGTPTEVDIHEVVTPDPDDVNESTDGTESAPAAAGKAAPEADDDTDDVDVQYRSLMAQIAAGTTV